MIACLSEKRYVREQQNEKPKTLVKKKKESEQRKPNKRITKHILSLFENISYSVWVYKTQNTAPISKKKNEVATSGTDPQHVGT